MKSAHPDPAAMIWSPFGSAKQARDAAGVLLQERLVACANILPEVQSIFSYEGEIQSESEIGVLFKTHGNLLNAATVRLAELHPYDTPAICGWLVDSAPLATREWLAGLLTGAKP